MVSAPWKWGYSLLTQAVPSSLGLDVPNLEQPYGTYESSSLQALAMQWPPRGHPDCAHRKEIHTPWPRQGGPRSGSPAWGQFPQGNRSGLGPGALVKLPCLQAQRGAKRQQEAGGRWAGQVKVQVDPLRDGMRAGATESVRGVTREGPRGRHRKVMSLAVPLSREGGEGAGEVRGIERISAEEQLMLSFLVLPSHVSVQMYFSHRV